MSLLMQALKKAEQAKKQQQDLPKSDAALEKTAPESPAAQGAQSAPPALPPSPQPEALSLSVLEPSEPSPVQNADTAPAQQAAAYASLFAQEEAKKPLAKAPALEKPATPAIPPLDFSPSPSDESHVKTNVAPSITSSAAPAIEPPAAPAVISTPGLPPSPSLNPALAKPELKLQEDAAVTAARQKARSVFASKQRPGISRKMKIVGASAAVIALTLAGFGYYTFELMAPKIATTMVAANTAPPPMTAANAAATPTPAPATLAAPMAEAPGNVAQPEKSTLSPDTAAAMPQDARATSQQATQDVPASITVGTVSKEKSATPSQQLPASVLAQSQDIRVRPTNDTNQINPTLNIAYQAFIAGDLAAAERQYQKVLQQESANRDALLGMAAIAIQRHQSGQAGSFYVKLLELNPSDPDAVAGLTGLQQGDLSQNESRLKKILTQHPQAGAVLFALGNLYAQQSRWSEAQQYYFRAFGSVPANGDYAFNLAVSLDRLNQPKLALDYYQRALTLAQSSSASFSKTAVQNRISELRAAAGN